MERASPTALHANRSDMLNVVVSMSTAWRLAAGLRTFPSQPGGPTNKSIPKSCLSRSVTSPSKRQPTRAKWGHFEDVRRNTLDAAGDVAAIDAELRLLAVVRQPACEHVAAPSTLHIDELLDERLACRVAAGVTRVQSFLTRRGSRVALLRAGITALPGSSRPRPRRNRCARTVARPPCRSPKA